MMDNLELAVHEFQGTEQDQAWTDDSIIRLRRVISKLKAIEIRIQDEGRFVSGPYPTGTGISGA